MEMEFGRVPRMLAGSIFPLNRERKSLTQEMFCAEVSLFLYQKSSNILLMKFEDTSAHIHNGLNTRALKT